MTIKHLRVFITVAQTGSMSAAAERLYFSQPTVSQIIRELETHYRVKLFNRYSQRLYITDAGKKLLGYALQTIKDFDQLEENMFLSSGQQLLRIGATADIGNRFILRTVRALKERGDCPEIQVYSGNTTSIEKRLLNAQLDVGILQGALIHDNLIAVPSISDRIVLVCAPEHPLAALDRIEPSALSEYPFCLREEGCGIRSAFARYTAKHKLSLTIKWEVSSPDAIYSAVLSDGCLAVLPLRQVYAQAAQGAIHIIAGDIPEWDLPYCLVYHKNRGITPELLAIQETLIAIAEPTPLERLKIGILGA